jgi:GT2 family glycosyltransferase
MDPRVAIVIITRDRPHELMRTLARLRALPERPAVLVVDNGSAGGVPAGVAARFPEVAVLAQERDLGAAGRTAGALAADAPYVAFCDDDSWWEPGSLSAAADLLDAHADVALLAARVELEGGRLEPTCAEMAEAPLAGRAGLPGPPVLGFVACGAVVRRDAYLAVGGFEPGWGVGGEEQPLAADLADRGWELVYVDRLTAQHRPSRRRDPAARRRIATRNDLWFAWRRRPAGAALRFTAGELRRAVADRQRGAGLIEAVRGGPDALRARRSAGPRVERRLAELASRR